MKPTELMYRRKWLRMLGCVAGCTALNSLVGCGRDAGAEQAILPEASELRRQVLRNEKPIQILSLAEAQAAYAEGLQVAVVGRIFSTLGSAFDRQGAAFHVIELPKPGHDHENPGDCPFCKRDLENATTAIVQVVDEQGQLLPAAADRLLGLKPNQDLVVEGSLNKVGEILIIQSRSLYLLSTDEALQLAQRIHA